MKGDLVLIWLWLLFVIVPIAELTILVWIGREVGAVETIAGVILIGGIGAWLARREGLRAWGQIHESMSQGRTPGIELLDALLIPIAGVLLITPGVLTDLLGILLLIPPIRRFIGRRLRDYFHRRIIMAQRPDERDVVDAKWREVKEEEGKR